MLLQLKPNAPFEALTDHWFHKLIEVGEDRLISFFYGLEKLKTSGWIDYTIPAYLTFIPFSPFEKKPLNETSAYRLSRFCYTRLEGDKIVLESPLFSGRIELIGPMGISLYFRLAKPCSLLELVAEFPMAKSYMELLVWGQMLVEEEELSQWAFHDLLFHSKTRLERAPPDFMKLYPFQQAPLPVVKSISNPIEIISLFRPDIEALKRSDVSFTQVLETRSSQRKQGKTPLTMEQLGEFLFRTARIQALKVNQCELSERPYPNAGALYELEIYPLIHSCEGLSAGLYHYDPLNHRLLKLREGDWRTESLLKQAQLSTQSDSFSQVLLIIAARFQRVSWKYPVYSYSLTLKNVGVLLQTMYLVATAMGLAPCAIGRGDGRLFSELIGSKDGEETSVGEFMLGSSGE